MKLKLLLLSVFTAYNVKVGTYSALGLELIPVSRKSARQVMLVINVAVGCCYGTFCQTLSCLLNLSAEHRHPLASYQIILLDLMLKVSIIQRAHLRIEKFESDIWEHLQLELIIKRITISAVICDKPLCIITRKAIAKKQK